MTKKDIFDIGEKIYSTEDIPYYTSYTGGSSGKAELHIVQEEELTNKELKNIENYISQRCEGLLDVEIKIVHEVQYTPRGKYIWAICNVER